MSTGLQMRSEAQQYSVLVTNARPLPWMVFRELNFQGSTIVLRRSSWGQWCAKLAWMTDLTWVHIPFSAATRQDILRHTWISTLYGQVGPWQKIAWGEQKCESLLAPRFLWLPAMLACELLSSSLLATYPPNIRLICQLQNSVGNTFQICFSCKRDSCHSKSECEVEAAATLHTMEGCPCLAAP